jgi:hypothetical protein
VREAHAPARRHGSDGEQVERKDRLPWLKDWNAESHASLESKPAIADEAS